MKAALSPLTTRRFMMMPETTNIRMLKMTIPNDTSVAWLPKKAAAIKVTTAILPVQGTRGALGVAPLADSCYDLQERRRYATGRSSECKAVPTFVGGYGNDCPVERCGPHRPAPVAGPTDQRSGRIPLLFGLTKSSWGDFHFWFSILAGLVTVLHLTIDWKALRACVRYLVTTHRGASPQP